MNKVQKILIEKYLSSEITGDELAEVRRLTIEDKNFNERLELRKALQEVEELQQEIQQRKEFDKWHTHRQQHRVVNRRNYYIFAGVAAIALFVFAGLWFMNSDKDVINEFSVNYYELNFKGGTGFNGNTNENKPILAGKTNLKIITNTKTSDSTYLFTNTNSLIIKLPKTSANLKKQPISVQYDYKSDSTFLIMLKDTFIVKNNTKYEKLKKYKK